MRPIRVAVLGGAHVHLVDYLRVLDDAGEGVRLVGLYEPDCALRATHGGRVTIVSDLDAALAADVVVVASTTAQHADLVGAAVEAGTALFVEKPLATDSPTVRTLAELIEDRGVPFATAMFLRCVPALQRLRGLLDREVLGELCGLQARFAHPGLLDGWFAGSSAWLTQPERGGVGGFADLAIHLLDTLLWLRPEASLSARGLVLEQWDGQRADVGGTALLDWGGVPVAVAAGWTSRPGGLYLHLDGTVGSATVEGGRLMVETDAGTVVDTGAAPDAGAALSAFLEGLRGRELWQAPTTCETVVVAELLEHLHELDGQAITPPSLP